MAEASDRDADRQADGASRAGATPDPPRRAATPVEPRARGWRREGVPSDTVGTGSFFALGCTLVVVAVIVVGVAIFLLLRLV